MSEDNDFENWNLDKLMKKHEDTITEIEDVLKKSKFNVKKFSDVLEMERELTMRET